MKRNITYGDIGTIAYYPNEHLGARLVEGTFHSEGGLNWRISLSLSATRKFNSAH
jgi:hypothetical protein